MTTKNTRIVWQVQSRISREHKWTNKGRFYARTDARAWAKWLRDARGWLGWGTTRVVRLELPIKAKKGKAA